MKTKVVVLDWDGVLYDSAEIYAAHFNTVLARYGKTMYALPEWQELVGPTAEESFRRAGFEDTDVPEAKRQFIELTRGEPRPTIFNDTYDTLRWLRDRNITAYIVSAHPMTDIGIELAKNDLLKFVAAIQGNASPQDKVAFLQNLVDGQSYSVKADELVFVDDMDTVLEVASSVGCYRVASARGYCSQERLLRVSPDKIIHNLKNLQGYIILIDELAKNKIPPGMKVIDNG